MSYVIEVRRNPATYWKGTSVLGAYTTKKSEAKRYPTYLKADIAGRNLLFLTYRVMKV